MTDPLQLKIEPSAEEMQEVADSLLKRRVHAVEKNGDGNGSDILRNLLVTPAPVILDVAELTADEQLLLEEEAVNLVPVLYFDDLQAGNMRALHHTIAAAVAQGVPVVDISRLYGLNIRTIKSLQEAPAFIELVAEYQDRDPDTIVFDLNQKMAAAAHDSIDLIREKMVKEGTGLSMGNLLAVADSTLDRTGYGRVTKKVNLTPGLDENNLKRIKDRPPERGELKTIEPTSQAPETD